MKYYFLDLESLVEGENALYHLSFFFVNVFFFCIRIAFVGVALN